MDFIKQSGVDVLKSVIVSSDSNADKDTDQALLSCLKRSGHIHNVTSVDDPTSRYHKNLIIEFKESSAVLALRPLLPYRHCL